MTQNLLNQIIPIVGNDKIAKIKIVDAISFPRIMLDVLIGCARRNSRVFSFLSKHIVDIVMNGENRTPRKQQSRRRTVIGPSFQFPGVEKGSE